MKKDHWVNSIFESASAINKVEANPYLWEKVNARLYHPVQEVPSSARYKLRWAVTIALLITLNVSAILIRSLQDQKQTQSSSVSALTDEMNSNTNYNY